MKDWRIMLGASFLMATSAVGPGFLTQTTVFTKSLGASFGFVILVSILLDVVIQLNVWRIIAVSERRAQDIADMVLPGLGKLLTLIIVIGGLAFNIGNVGGAGLGFTALLDIPTSSGAVVAAILSIGLFLHRDSKKIMDVSTQVMGLAMILLILYVAVTSAPPLSEAVRKTFFPERVDSLAILTLVGGTVGGYITFAGAHRLLDAGVKGVSRLKEVNTSAVWGVSVASLIRVLLFLASLGIVGQGLPIDDGNPTASVFNLAAGKVGYRLFGVLMIFASVTSIIGSAYTSVSFLKSLGGGVQRNENRVIISFITVSTLIFLTIGKPVNLLIFAGALNGLILPVTLGTMLIAARKVSIVGNYTHPKWMSVLGLLVFLMMLGMGVYTLKISFF
ncbi:MAG TPA: NRAMP family divalent metal transporter [Bacteriovoracaceae bacterium]|nr:NRAMP family divalent metal transporter [Bacteriovoracaceae bacterium]